MTTPFVAQQGDVYQFQLVRNIITLLKFPANDFRVQFLCMELLQVTIFIFCSQQDFLNLNIEIYLFSK